MNDLSPAALVASPANVAADAWLAAIVESSDDAIISKNLDSIIISWNNAAERILGYRAEEAIGRPITILIPPELQSEEQEILAQLKAGKRIEHYETTRTTKAGAKISVSLTISPVKDADGKVVGASKILRDITEQKKMQAELHRLAFIVHHAGWAIAAIDSATNRIHFCNGAFAKMHGYTTEEMSGMDFLQTFDPGWRSNWSEHEPRIKQGGDYIYESLHVRKDGSTFPVRTHATTFKDEHGRAIFRASVFEDITERQQLESVLRRQQEHFRSTISQVKDYAIFTTDEQGVITSWNEGCRKVLGYEESEFIGMDGTELFTPEDVAAGVPEQELQTARERDGASDDRWMMRKDGRRFWANGITSSVRDDAGQVVGFTKVMRDRTEQQQIELALRESEATKSAMLDSGLDGIIMMNHERTILDFNAAAESIFGYRAEEAIGRTVEDLIVPPSLREAHVRGVNRYLATGESHILGRRIEIKAMRSDRSEFPCELTIVRVQLPGPPRFTAFIRDITDRQRIETAIRESEERYRTLFNSIDEGFTVIEILFDAQTKKAVDYRFLEVNPSFERQTGLKNVQGRTILELLPKHESYWFEAYGKIALTGKAARFQSSAAELGKWYDVYAFQFGDPRKRQVAVLFNDITQRRQMEEDLKLTRDELARRAADLEQAVAARTMDLRATIAELEGVSYSLSHDMRAPLRTMRSFCEIVLAEAGARLEEQEKALLNKSISAAGRLDRLIQDVLIYSRVSRESISLEVIDIESLLQQIIEERPEFHPPNAEIEIETPLIPVRGHEAYLTQCVTNLLDNAVKFVAPGITPQVRIWTESRINDVRVYFEDNGIGIPEEAQKRIFGIFERIHGTEDFPGTGIGLAIVRKAVDRMGGTVGVRSTEGRGSQFWLQLPKDNHE